MLQEPLSSGGRTTALFPSDAIENGAVGKHVVVVVTHSPEGRLAEARLRVSWVMGARASDEAPPDRAAILITIHGTVSRKTSYRRWLSVR
jgi:hypothetical protein